MKTQSWFAKCALVATMVAAGFAVSAVPASAAGTAHCSSLTLDRVSLFPNQDYIVGSCTPADPRPGAQMKFTVTCHVTGDRDVYVTLDYGKSFRADTGCGGWGAQSLTYNPTYGGEGAIGMQLSQKITGVGVMAVALVMGSVAGPAQAGVGGCSSLGIDGRYIVGSCTADNPGPNATVDLGFQCIGDIKGAMRYATVTVGYGSSFRYDSQCWIGLQDVWRDDYAS